MRCFLLITIFAMFVLCPAPAVAGLEMETTLSDAALADRATAIVVGKVLEVVPAPVDSTSTDYLIGVEQVISGELLHSPVVVRVQSGVLDPETRPRIFGGQLLSRGQRTLLFLTPGLADGTYEIEGRVDGAFHIHRVAGRDVAYRTFWPQTEPYRPETGTAHEKLRDLAAFQHWLVARAAGKSAMDYFLNADTSVLVADPPAQPAMKMAQPIEADKAIIPVTANDPAGDATPNSIQFPSPDFVAGSVRSQGNSLEVIMQFADQTFVEGTTEVSWDIDIDEDSTTGLAGIPGSTTSIPGFEFLLVFYEGEVEVRKFDPTLPPGGSLVRVIAMFPVTVLEDGYRALIALSLLDDDESFRFGFSVSARGGGFFTSVTDVMPDLDLPALVARPQASTPGTPSGLQAMASGPGQIDLTWVDNANNEQAFDIQRRDNGGSFATIGSVGQNATSFADVSVGSGTMYTYRVRARNTSGVSDWSAIASATTPGEPAPSSLSAVGLSSQAILLSWDDNSASEDGYEVEMKSGDSAFTRVSTAPADSTGTTIDGLDEATFYTFRVRSTGGAGTSSYSNEAGATTFFADVEPCVASATRLCLNQGRFAIEVEWENFEGDVGSAADAGLVSPDSGLLYFFDPDNWEMLLKVLDACDFNGHFWVFSAASTNVEYTLTVTDSITGFSKSYTNPLGTASPAITDTQAFATCSAQVPDPAPVMPAVEAILPDVASLDVETGKGGTCVPSDTTMCLGDGRFQVEVDWVTDDDSGSGRVDPFQSPDSGLFWFFTASNLELMVKVLDGCGINDRVWVFSAATTDVEYTLRVLDTVTGEEAAYNNPPGTAAEAVTDVEALASCG